MKKKIGAAWLSFLAITWALLAGALAPSASAQTSPLAVQAVSSSNQGGTEVIRVDFTQPLGRTMPLCKFPEMARYKGRGNVNDAANWACPGSDKSMLKIGESGRRAGVIE